MTVGAWLPMTTPLLETKASNPSTLVACTVEYTVVPGSTLMPWSTSNAVSTPTSCQGRTSHSPAVVPTQTLYRSVVPRGAENPPHRAEYATVDGWYDTSCSGASPPTMPSLTKPTVRPSVSTTTLREVAVICSPARFRATMTAHMCVVLVTLTADSVVLIAPSAKFANTGPASTVPLYVNAPTLDDTSASVGNVAASYSVTSTDASPV